MFSTTTWPTATTQRRAAPGGDAPGGDAPSPAGVARIRVTRRAARTHRERRDVRLPRIRRSDTYLVRLTRPADAPGVALLRPAPAAAPHRVRIAR